MKLMVLGANDLQVPLISQAKARGIKTIVVTPIKNEIGTLIADEVVYCDVRDGDTILKNAQAIGIDGIITDQTDIAVRSVAFVAEKMGLPGIGYETACLFTDKYRMREKLRQLGIETLRYQKTRSLDEAKAFLAQCGGRAIIKPVDNQGSRGVSLVDSENKLEARFQEAMEYSRQKEVLVEEIAHGREFVVEGLAFENRFQNLICGDTYYFDIPDVFSATQRAFPTTAEPTLRKRVEEMNKRILTGFGMKQGISHSEYIMDRDRIILLETAARGGGVFISSDLISLSTGLNTEDFLINIALGLQSGLPEIRHDLCACCYLAFFLPVGTVKETRGISEVIGLPYTHRHNLMNIHVGMKTKPHTDKTSRFFVIIDAESRESLRERVMNIRSLLDGIQVSCNDGTLEGPIWE